MIQLGPKGLSQRMKRILNLLVEEISLVDKAATRRKFVLIKRDGQDKSLEVPGGELRRTNFMGSKETKKGVKETVELERSEELALPPDALRVIKEALGGLAKVSALLSKLADFKYKATYRSTTPGDKEEEEAENERKNARGKDKDKEEEEPEEDDDDDKKKKKNLTQTKKDKEIENAEVSEELETKLTDLLSKLEDLDESDPEKERIQKKIDEIEKQMNSDAGGED